MDKKSLDIIVEEFFDTGKLVLNELDIPDEQKDKLRGVGKELKDKKNLIMSFFNNLINGQKNKDIPTKSIKFFITALDIFNENTHINNDILNGRPGRENIIDNLNTYIFDATKKIEEYLKKTIKEGVDFYRSGNYEESTQKYEEVINTYYDIPIKVRESLDVDITLLQGWIKNNQKLIDDINRNRIHTDPKVSDEFLSKLQKFKEENPDLFIKLNLKNEKDVEEITIQDDIKFNDLLKQQIEEDKTYRYGKWSIGSISNDTLNNLERIYIKPKGENQIYTTYTIDDLKESIMKVIFSKEGQTIIMRNTILTDYGLSNMGGILYRLTSANLINKGQIRLINKGDKDWDIKNKINKSSKASDSKIVPTPITVDQFLTILGFDRLDSLPIQYVSTKKPSPADEYEQSFGTICGGVKYFQVTTGEGNSSIISAAKSYNKKLLRLVGDSNMSVDSITADTYSEIITNGTLKYDIKSLTTITLTGFKNTDENIELNVGDPIEVKKSPYEKGFHLIEFYGAFKNIKKPKVDEYEYMDKFTNVLEGLRKKLQSELESKSGKGWEIIKSINDVTKGIFFENYIFVPKDSYELSWSLEGARQKREPRLTIRVDCKLDKPVYKWEDGNCNLDEPNTIEESITNFFDTGNFEF